MDLIRVKEKYKTHEPMFMPTPLQSGYLTKYFDVLI